MSAHPFIKTPWRWAILGAVGGLCLGVTVFAPASWLAAGIRAASAGHVQLLQTRGTVWSGEGELVLTGGTGSAQAVALPGLMQWKLRPAWSGFRLALQSDCCTPQPLEVQAQWHGAVVVGNGESHWPASLLTGLGTPWNTVAPQGQLHVRTQDVRVAWQQGAKLQGNLCCCSCTLVPIHSLPAQLCWCARVRVGVRGKAGPSSASKLSG